MKTNSRLRLLLLRLGILNIIKAFMQRGELMFNIFARVCKKNLTLELTIAVQ